MRFLKGILFSILLCSIAPVFAGPAVNQFELKELESEPGSIEFQSQNAHAFGQPDREFIEEEPGEFEFDDNTVIRQRHALELEFGVTDYFRTRVGIEYEKERLEEPSTPAEVNDFAALRLEEIAVEAVLVFVPVTEQNIGYGMLAEYQHPTESEEAKSIVFGPIIEAHRDRWSAIANLTFVHFFDGSEEEIDNKWDFSYAGQLMYDASDHWDIALEAYGTVDRLGHSGTRSEAAEIFGDHDQHRIGSIFYYGFQTGGSNPTLVADDDEQATGMHVSIGTGLLFGLNSNTPDVTLKWSVEVEF